MAFFLCVILLVVKGWDRLVQPHLWAEDGTIFLQDALTNPWLSIFEQFGGYFQIFQRLVIHLLALFPLSWLPALIVLTSYVLYAAFAAQFARPAFRDYVPSDSARVMTSALLCFLPGIGEVAGNLANIFRPMFVFTWFLAVKPPRLALRTWELLALALFAFSAGQVIVILPMLFFRLYYQVRERQLRPVIRREASAIVVVLLSGVVSALQPYHPSTLARPLLSEVISTAASLMPRVLVFQPWLGPQWTIKLTASHGYFMSIVGVLVLGAIAWLLLKRRGLAGRQILLGLLAAYAVWPLTMSVRPEALQLVREAPEFFWTMRWGYQMAPFAVILWVTLLCLPRYPYRKGSVQLAAVFAIVYLLSNRGYSSIGAYGTDLDWQADVAKLEMAIDTGCPPDLFIPIYPARWGIWNQGDTKRCLATLKGSRENKQPVSNTPQSEQMIWVDVPAPGSLVESSFVVAGWAIDRRASSGTGVQAVHAWALPTSTGAPIFLGQATLEGDRQDVGEVYGAQFSSSGYTLTVEDIPPGNYDLLVAAYSNVTSSFDSSRSTSITVAGSD